MDYSWYKIELPQLVNLADLSQRKCGDELEIVERDQEMLSVFTSKPIGYFDTMTPKQFNAERIKMYELIHRISKEPFVKWFKIGGVKFSFKCPESISEAREFAKAKGITEESFFNDIAHVVACFYHPSAFSIGGKKYLDIKEREKLFSLHAPASAIFSLSNLFASASPLLTSLVFKKMETDVKELEKLAG